VILNSYSLAISANSLKSFLTIDEKVSDHDINIPIWEYFSRYISLAKDPYIIKSNNYIHLNSIPKNKDLIINLDKINEFEHLNKYVKKLHEKLAINGIFIGFVELYEQRKKRILGKHTTTVSYPIYLFDILFNRILSKLLISNWLYKIITKGKQIALSEVLGRLLSEGFEIVDIKELTNISFIVCKKTNTPLSKPSSNSGIVIKLNRVGKNGNLIKVYKIRTMHPYGEYLQNYVYMQSNLIVDGKITDDFRITSWGKILRKYWIDELPMILNLLKGDLKFFGVRPLSIQHYNLYREDLKLKRIKFKPGLLPPFYSDLPKDFNEKMDSEEKYLDLYEKKPFKTDLKYAMKTLYNIIFKGARSS